MKKINKTTLGILIFLIAVTFMGFFYFNSLNSFNNPNNYIPQTTKLASVEINSYNGTKLDSFINMPENAIKGTQYINISNYTLKIEGLVQNPMNYTYQKVLSHQSYEKVVTLNCVEGWSADILWKGVLIEDLFNEAKPLPTATVVIFHATDGYTVNYPVSYFANKSIILAYAANNVTIPPAQGYPFMFVAEDKWGYKWIKWIDVIEFSNDTNYKGYWESRGYSKEGNLNESEYS